MPLLRTVLLEDVSASKVDLPWEQLTSLTLSYLRADECTPILQQTSNLVHCTLDLWPGGSESLPDITLACLESLTFSAMDADPPVTGYLNTFIVPTLCSLQIEEQCLGLDPFGSLTSFISKSGCKPQQLCITGRRTITRRSFRKAFPSIPKFILLNTHGLEVGSVSESSDNENDSSSE